MSDRIRITEADLRTFMRDSRYWQAGNPERQAYVGWVTDGFRALYGDEGEAKAGAVWVKPYSRTRDGQVEQVAGHWRSPPPGRDAGDSKHDSASGSAGDSDVILAMRRPKRPDDPPPIFEGSPGGANRGSDAPRPRPSVDPPARGNTGAPRPGAPTPEELASRAIPEGTATARGTRIMRVPEGAPQQGPDFQAMTAGRPVEVYQAGRGRVEVGSTADGRTVIARGSRDGRLTIEVQRRTAEGNVRTQYEFRYGEK